MEEKKIIIRCPMCGSSDLCSKTKGFSIGNAAIGAFLIGPIGGVAGFIGKGRVKLKCNNCMRSFDANDAIKDDSGDSEDEAMEIAESINSSSYIAAFVIALILLAIITIIIMMII